MLSPLVNTIAVMTLVCICIHAAVTYYFYEKIGTQFSTKFETLDLQFDKFGQRFDKIDEQFRETKELVKEVRNDLINKIDRMEGNIIRRIDDGTNQTISRIDNTNSEVVELRNEIKVVSENLSDYDKRIAVNESQIETIKTIVLGRKNPGSEELGSGGRSNR